MWIREIIINRTEGYTSHFGEWYDAFQSTVGELFRDCQREHGRCTSKMYRDTVTGKSVQCGWVFEKQEMYSDTREPFMRETWVEVSLTEPKIERVVTNIKYPWREVA